MIKRGSVDNAVMNYPEDSLMHGIPHMNDPKYEHNNNFGLDDEQRGFGIERFLVTASSTEDKKFVIIS